uniref:Uncharacterized protein n=1 Tax=Cyclopterus lumpus TaxID=8103 RepID=A0A8C3A1R8_CYCLU
VGIFIFKRSKCYITFKCHKVHKWRSVLLYARLFLLVSPTYAAFLWCYPDKSPAAVSVTSHSHDSPNYSEQS